MHLSLKSAYLTVFSKFDMFRMLPNGGQRICQVRHNDKINDNPEISLNRSWGWISHILPDIFLIFTCLFFYLSYLALSLGTHLHPSWKCESERESNHYEYRVNLLVSKECAYCSFPPPHFSASHPPIFLAVCHHCIQMKDSSCSIQQSTNDYPMIFYTIFLFLFQSKSKPLTICRRSFNLFFTEMTSVYKWGQTYDVTVIT